MQVSDFNYDLPQELIAQTPMEPRDHSRLLVVDKDTGKLEHRHFYDLPNYLRPDDLLVFNDTRVIPARLHGTKDTGAKAEVFLLTRLNATDWEVLVRPGKRLRIGAKIKFSDDLSCEIVDNTEFGGRLRVLNLKACLKKFWTALAKRRCRRTLPKSWKTKNAIRRCTAATRAALPHRRPACTLPKSFCRR